MEASNRSARRRQQAQPCPESLESRSLMTGGAGNTFALVPGQITTPGGTAVVNFTIDPAQFTLPKGRVVIGIDVAPTSNSQLQPAITQVNNLHSHLSAQAIGTTANLHGSHAAVARTPATHAVLVPIVLGPGKTKQPTTYSVVVTGASMTSGSFLLGFYLPGDVNGTGIVDQSAVSSVRSLLGSKSTDANYSFDADANRDGRITKSDLSYAMQNLGVTTTITPLVTAQLDPASDTGIQDRITSLGIVHFTGQGTPGAAITYAETGSAPLTATATADATGAYSLMIPIGAGVNNFLVTSVDGFGQTISGQISPVTYNANAPNYPIPLVNSQTTAPSTTTSTGSGSSSTTT
jgi:hypothetical protein